VLEAMACGLPVVGVDAGGVAESVDHAVGQLAWRSDSAALAEAVAALFERDLALVGRTARTRAETRHGWNRVFEQLAAIYARLTCDTAFVTPPPALTRSSR
ncbi:MAG TPA: glycosyltransferase, partial [Caulobacter sp.]|nr:glycosyltransferase [Caulobacter sp.]